MDFITNQVADAFVDEQLAYDAVREALLASDNGTGRMHPVVIVAGAQPGESFSIKSGSCAAVGLIGFKVGAYWPGNLALGIPRHGTTVFLIDPANGRLACVVRGDRLNGFRTAASDAVATDLLARKNASTLAILGSGHQAEFEARAICRIRPITQVLIAARNPVTADRLATALEAHDRPVAVVDMQTACSDADIIVTVTPSREPLFDHAWVAPGTHISAMGADQKGKRELPLELLRQAVLFADNAMQSVEIGEFQHIREEVAAGVLQVTNIAAVMEGKAPGRQSDTQITIYDSSGLSLQDLYVAAAVVCRARRSGRVLTIAEEGGHGENSVSSGTDHAR